MINIIKVKERARKGFLDIFKDSNNLYKLVKVDVIIIDIS